MCGACVCVRVCVRVCVCVCVCGVCIPGRRVHSTAPCVCICVCVCVCMYVCVITKENLLIYSRMGVPLCVSACVSLC